MRKERDLIEEAEERKGHVSSGVQMLVSQEKEFEIVASSLSYYRFALYSILYADVAAQTANRLISIETDS